MLFNCVPPGGGGGGGALTCIGGTGMCRFDDPLFQTPIAALKIPDFQSFAAP